MRLFWILVSSLVLLGMMTLGGFVAGVAFGEREAEKAFCEDQASPRYIADPEIMAMVCP